MPAVGWVASAGAPTSAGNCWLRCRVKVMTLPLEVRVTVWSPVSIVGVTDQLPEASAVTV